jgi:hypothetical protein
MYKNFSDNYFNLKIFFTITGLDLARIGDHYKVEKFLDKKMEKNEFAQRNQMQIERYNQLAEKTVCLKIKKNSL